MHERKLAAKATFTAQTLNTDLRPVCACVVAHKSEVPSLEYKAIGGYKAGGGIIHSAESYGVCVYMPVRTSV